MWFQCTVSWPLDILVGYRAGLGEGGGVWCRGVVDCFARSRRGAPSPQRWFRRSKTHLGARHPTSKLTWLALGWDPAACSLHSEVCSAVGASAGATHSRTSQEAAYFRASANVVRWGMMPDDVFAVVVNHDCPRHLPAFAAHARSKQKPHVATPSNSSKQ